MALEKSKIVLNTSGLKKLLPSQIHQQGEKQESDFTVFTLIPDLHQHMVLPPFPSLIFDSSIQKILTEVRSMQMDKHIEQQEALSVLEISWHIWGWRVPQLNLVKCGYVRKGWALAYVLPFVFLSLERH